MRPPDPEAILAQDDWLRRIARHLVDDPDLADDLVQDAWLASLQAGRRGTAARPWLMGVLRNSGAQFFRSRDRHGARAIRDARDGLERETPAPDELVADLQLREILARELQALEEPFRTAVYLRFVTDVSIKEVARRTRVAPSTASERVTRGLALLRERMDRAHGGHRRAWIATLLPLSRPKGLSALTLSTLAMNTTTKVGIVAALLVGALLLLQDLFMNDLGTDGHVEPAGLGMGNTTASATPLDLPTPLGTESRRAPSRPDSALGREALPDDPTAALVGVQPDDQLHRFRVRCITTDGAPLPGVVVRMTLDAGGGEDFRGESTVDGVVVIHGLPAGKYLILAQHPIFALTDSTFHRALSILVPSIDGECTWVEPWIYDFEVRGAEVATIRVRPEAHVGWSKASVSMNPGRNRLELANERMNVAEQHYAGIVYPKAVFSNEPTVALTVFDAERGPIEVNVPIAKYSSAPQPTLLDLTSEIGQPNAMSKIRLMVEDANGLPIGLGEFFLRRKNAYEGLTSRRTSANVDCALPAGDYSFEQAALHPLGALLAGAEFTLAPGDEHVFELTLPYAVREVQFDLDVLSAYAKVVIVGDVIPGFDGLRSPGSQVMRNHARMFLPVGTGAAVLRIRELRDGAVPRSISLDVQPGPGAQRIAVELTR